MNPILFIGAIFCLMGALFVLIALLLRRHQRRRREAASGLTVATVVDIRRVRSHRRDGYNTVTYHPVYEYAAGGETRRTESGFGSSPCPFQIGEQVELRYVPDAPGKIWVEKETRIARLIMGIFGGIGGLFFLIGGGMLAACFLPR